MPQSKISWGNGITILIAVAGLIGATVLLIHNLDKGTAAVALSAGAVLLLAIIALVVVYFSLGLSKNQALGLPKGSVRALLALSFVAAFVGLSLYLLTQVTPSSSTHSFSNVPLSVVTQLGGTVTSIKQDPGSSPVTYSGTIETQDTSKRDLALQIFTASSTLVASVSAFYFGSRATASAQAVTVTGADQLKVVSPPNDPLDLTATAPGVWPPVEIHVAGGGSAGIKGAVQGDAANTLVANDKGVFTYTASKPDLVGGVVLTFAASDQPSNNATLTVRPH